MIVDEAKKNRREWFLESRFGMFIHWGLYSITGRDMWYYSTEEEETESYERLFNKFNPVDYNPSEWAKTAKDAGMKYAVFTVKHHEGFCLWDTKYSEFKITNTPYGKDLLQPWLDAFRKEGLKVGIYFSTIDWHHPDFTVDCIHPRRANAAELNKKRDFSKYVEFMHNQLRELMTEYGDIDILWPDFSYKDWHFRKNDLPGKGAKDWKSEELLKMIEELQPGILYNNRLGWPGEIKSDFGTPEQHIPDSDVAKEDNDVMMWEACETLGSGWGYVRADKGIKSAGTIIKDLVSCVSNNGNLILNVGPTPRGIIQKEFVEILKNVGEWMKTNNESIYGTGACEVKIRQAFCPEFHPLFTQKDKNIYMHCLTQYPPYNIILTDLGDKVDYVEFVSDKTEIEFKEVVNDEHNNIKLIMPIINPDPYDTVIRIKLK